MLYFWIAIVGCIASALSAAIAAITVNAHRYKKTASGTLKVNNDDPDGPYLFLELSKEDLADIANKKQVILDVQIISQK